MVSFRGASADGYAAVADRVGAVPQAEAAATADDLFAVAQTLRGEGTLRRFATDQSIASEARQGVVRDVFSGKVGAEALDVLGVAASRRWTRSRDLADALEQAGVVSAVRSAGEEVDRLVDELFAVRRTVTEHSDLRNALSDPVRSSADKSALVAGLLSGKALEATVQLVRQAISGSHRTIVVALEEYESVAADVRGQGVATVHVAAPLSDADQQRLASALSSQYGRPVHLNVVVDPAVLGGIRVEIGDDVIDGTVASRLDDARRKIAG